MSITGLHLLFYSPEAEKLRTALAEVFGWPSVDAHPGWPIFATPPAELGVHPGDAGHEISLMCDDLDETVEALRAKDVKVVGEPEERRFGRAVYIELPGEVKVLLYCPAHPTALGLAK